MKKLVNQETKRVTILDDRFYTQDEKTFYPSVTTVLQSYPKGAFFERWLKDVGHNADRVRDEAGIQGTNVHDAIEFFLRGGTLRFIEADGTENFTENEWRMISNFMKFWDYEGIDRTELFIEEILFSSKRRVGGTADLVVMIDGQRWLIDYKTSNAMHQTYHMQLAEYTTIWNEMFPKKKIDRYGILWLNAKTRTEKPLIQGIGWQLKEFTGDYEKDQKLYDATRLIWDQENPNYKPRNKEYQNEFKMK